MGEILKSLKVNSTPPRRIRKIIGDTSLTLADAVAEIVANSLDARESEDDRISVDICLDRQQVIVVDDASGMTGEILEQAIRLGIDMGKTLGRGADRMGYFGLGMKTACASIGDWWAIITRPKGGNEELVVEFDLLCDESDLGSSLWEDEIIVRTPDHDGPLGTRPHGTAIIISKLHRHDTVMVGSVVRRLGQAFKGHLEQGDVIRVKTTDGEVIECKPPDFQRELVLGSRVDFRLPVNEGDPSKIIYGWLALTKSVGTKGDRGFNIYRKGQLIQAWNKDWYYYHPTTSYLLGDVHLDFIRANFFKKGLQEQSDEWAQVTRVMKEFLKPAVAAARKMRKGKTPNERLEIVSVMRSELQGVADAQGGEISCALDTATSSSAGSQGGDAPASDEPCGSERDAATGITGGISDGENLPPPTPPIRVSLKSLTLHDGQVIALDFAEEALDTQMTPWDYISPPGKDQLLAVVNTRSELYRQLNDRRMLLALAVSDAILQFLIEQKGKSAYEARAVRNEWLHTFLVSKEVRL